MRRPFFVKIYLRENTHLKWIWFQDTLEAIPSIPQKSSWCTTQPLVPTMKSKQYESNDRDQNVQSTMLQPTATWSNALISTSKLTYILNIYLNYLKYGRLLHLKPILDRYWVLVFICFSEYDRFYKIHFQTGFPIFVMIGFFTNEKFGCLAK